MKPLWALGLLLWLPSAAFGGVFKVGTFSKSTAAAPAVQVVPHGLGTTPSALILWSVGTPDQTTSTDALVAVGFSDGTTARSVSAAASNGGATSNASRRLADAALTEVSPGEVLRLEAALVGWDDSAFTLRWTTNNAVAERIHYLVLGGEDLLAKVVAWPMPTVAGARAVTGVGFRPDVVLHLHGGAGLTAAGSLPHALMGLGAMDSGGRTWANAFGASDALAPSEVNSGQRTGQALTAVSGVGSSTLAANLISMDADGFTLDFTTASATGGTVVSLALKGVQGHAASFTRNSGASQTITLPGFRPSLVLLSSYEFPNSLMTNSHAGWYLGASDGVSEATTVFAARDNVSPVQTWRKSNEARCIATISALNGASDYAATLTPVATGFTVTWVTPSTLPDDQLFLALRPLQACGVCDTLPPDTSIASGPPAMSSSSSATFDFVSNETLATFECRVTPAAVFTACADPLTLTGLTDGSRTLEVRAKDPTGNVDPTPAVQTWVVTLPDAGGPADAGDAGGTADAGDAGGPVDAKDAGGPVDAGDAGPTGGAQDAGLTADAGDSGTVLPEPDAGPGAPAELAVGCSCGAGSGPVAALLALLLALAARRRRR